MGLHEPDCNPVHERDVIDGYKSFPSGAPRLLAVQSGLQCALRFT